MTEACTDVPQDGFREELENAISCLDAAFAAGVGAIPAFEEAIRVLHETTCVGKACAAARSEVATFLHGSIAEEGDGPDPGRAQYSLRELLADDWEPPETVAVDLDRLMVLLQGADPLAQRLRCAARAIGASAPASLESALALRQVAAARRDLDSASAELLHEMECVRQRLAEDAEALAASVSLLELRSYLVVELLDDVVLRRTVEPTKALAAARERLAMQAGKARRLLRDLDTCRARMDAAGEAAGHEARFGGAGSAIAAIAPNAAIPPVPVLPDVESKLRPFTSAYTTTAEFRVHASFVSESSGRPLSEMPIVLDPAGRFELLEEGA